jgi:hypothetical protein
VNDPEPKVAERDIECYKVFYVKNNADGSKTYCPVRNPESMTYVSKVYPPNSVRGIEIAAEGEHTWSGMERILYKTLKTGYYEYEEDRLYRMEAGWIHGFKRLADAKKFAYDILTFKTIKMVKGASLEVWKCIIRKGKPYHEGFMLYVFPHGKYGYCVCAESMILAEFVTTIDVNALTERRTFTVAIVDDKGDELYPIRSGSGTEWRKADDGLLSVGESERVHAYFGMTEADYYDAYICAKSGEIDIRLEYSGTNVDTLNLPKNIHCEKLRIKEIKVESFDKVDQGYACSVLCDTSLKLVSTLVEWNIYKLEYWKPFVCDMILHVSERETIIVYGGGGGKSIPYNVVVTNATNFS